MAHANERFGIAGFRRFRIIDFETKLPCIHLFMRHVSVERNKLPAIFRADADSGHDNLAGGTVDDFCRACVNLAALVDKRQCNQF